MRGLDDVVRALGPLRIAGEATAGTELREVLTAGEQLVDVRLVPGVEDDGVVRRVEDAVQGDRQLDHAEIGAEVAAGARDVLDQELAHLAGEPGQLFDRQRVEVTRARDRREKRHPCSLPRRRFACPVYLGRCMAKGPGAPPAPSRDVLRPGCAARTGGCRRCGSSPLRRACRCGRPPRTRPSPCRAPRTRWARP